MRFTTVEDVKKWLRGLPLRKKELEMKSEFYRDLIHDSEKMGTVGEKYIAYYEEQTEKIHQEIQNLARHFDAMLELLDPEERMILTARYVKQLLWDTMEFHVHYSRRQAIRIHNQAVAKLTGIEIGRGLNTNEGTRQQLSQGGTGSGQVERAFALR